MGVFASIFFDIQVPNPTTWFYLSGLLAVALFFKFSRVFSVRNLDVVTLHDLAFAIIPPPDSLHNRFQVGGRFLRAARLPAIMDGL